MGFVVDVVLPVSLAFIMLSLGLGLTFEDFARVARQPRDVAVGLLSQIFLLPAVAFLIASAWPLTPELALGVMIIAAAPGGITSNIMTAFARGDVALSISLTAVTSLLAVLTMPFIVVTAYVHFLGEQTGRDISVIGIAIPVFLIVTVPALLGLVIRHKAPASALAVEPAFRRVSGLLFLLVLFTSIWQERANIVPYFAEAGLVALTLNLVMMVLAYGLARLFISGARQRTAITIECGLQNGSLALTVGLLLFAGGPAVIPAATYSLIMFGTALAYIAFVRRPA